MLGELYILLEKVAILQQKVGDFSEQVAILWFCDQRLWFDVKNQELFMTMEQFWTFTTIIWFYVKSCDCMTIFGLTINIVLSKIYDFKTKYSLLW